MYLGIFMNSYNKSIPFNADGVDEMMLHQFFFLQLPHGEIKLIRIFFFSINQKRFNVKNGAGVKGHGE